MGPRTFLACVLLGLLSACSSQPPSADASVGTVQNSANSLDWAGIYEGITPCADCPGIDTIVQLRSNGTYVLNQKYLNCELAPRRSGGSFTWDAAGRKGCSRSVAMP